MTIVVICVIPAFSLAQSNQLPVQKSLPQTLPGRLADLNGELVKSAASRDPDAVHIGQLLEERAKLLAELIESDPAKAIAASLAPEIAARSRTIAPAVEIESQGNWEGVLEAKDTDGFDRQASVTRWYLRTASRKFEVYTSSPTIPQAGTTARASGIMIAGRIAAGSLLAIGSQRAAAQSFGRIPLTFEENAGQGPPDVKFLARGSGYVVLLYSDHAAFRLKGQEGRTNEFQMRWSGGAANLRIAGAQPVITTSNYLLGNDPKLWRTGIRNYGAVEYESVAPGVNLIFHGRQKQLEYDVVVKPGADLSNVAFDLLGFSDIAIDKDGDLVLRTPAGSLVQRKPLVYETSGTGRRVVEARYAMAGRNRVRFAVGEYDKTKSLIIDPVLSYATYLGGAGDDAANAVAVDPDGNAYVTGSTGSPNFPLQNAEQSANGGGSDVFVAKINPSGTALIYATYLGGSFDDAGLAIALDSARNAYITGSTSSWDFPTTSTTIPFHSSPPNYYHLGFVVELSASGSTLVFSSYLGKYGPTQGSTITVDSANKVYVGGTDGSGPDPLGTAGAFQTRCYSYNCGFVAKINPSGTGLAFWTYLQAGSGPVQITSIAVGTDNTVVATGYTPAWDFPTTPGAFQLSRTTNFWNEAFVTKFKADGSGLVYSTYLGGSGDDFGRSIALDSIGNAYVAGDTTSTDFPVTGTVSDSTSGNIFVTKLNPAGSALVYSVRFGSNGAPLSPFAPAPRVSGMVLDPFQNVIVAGGTSAPDFPLTGGAVQASVTYENAGVSGGFISKLNDTGTALLYSTMLGGPSDTGAVATDGAGNIYVAGSASYLFPATVNAYQTTRGSSVCCDAFIAKIDVSSTCAFSISPSSASPGINGGVIQVTVTSSNGCNWATVSPTGWVQVSGAAGVGNGIVNLNVQPNPGPPRGATISIAGNTFTVSQGSSCSYQVSYTPVTLTSSGGSAGSFSVSSGVSCGWTASTSVGWLQVSYYNYNGSGSATLNATANFGLPRAGTVTVAGQVFTITQPGGSMLSISKSHTGSFAVQQNATYQVTVSNGANAASTSGTVTVTDTMPSGMTLVSMAGTGWTCPGTAANNCTRGDALNSGASYPPITVTVNVPANATSPQVNSVTVSGGGSAAATAGDSTVILVSTAVPSVVSVTPSSGSGPSQAFQFQVSDTDGAGDLASLEAWFTPTSKSAASTCLIYYGVASHLIYLASDDVSNWSSHAIGSAGMLTNSQCTVDAGATTVTPSGNNLTLSVPIAFKPGYAGFKQIFMFAVGSVTNSGWQIMGNWTPSTAAVNVVSVTPNTGRGTSQFFQFQASDTGGNGDLVAIEGWFTPTSSTAENTCLIYYATYTQLLYLASDDVSSWTSQNIGTPGILQNSQCTVNVVGATVTGSGNNMTLTVPIAFNDSFSGVKQIFMFGVGTTGNSGWQVMGNWTPSNAGANAVSVTPNAGSGSSQTFQFLASDTGGAADLVAVEGWFTPNSTATANTCLIYYATYTHLLYLANDNGSSWNSQTIGTPGILENSQCSVNVGGASATASGNNLALSVPVTFKAGFTGAKQVWMYAAGTTNNSGWHNNGSWTAP